MGKKKVDLLEGQTFLPKSNISRHNFRRIVGVVGDCIVYSVGGDRNFSCKRSSFMAWRGEKAPSK